MHLTTAAVVCLPLLSGCFTTRTLTLVPGAKGVVIAQASGTPLSDVTVIESSHSFPPSHQPKTGVTSAEGGFYFPPITAGKAQVLIAPGAGVPVSRTLVFKKEGYVSRHCTLTDLSLFSELKTLSVGLLKEDPNASPEQAETEFMAVAPGVECSVTAGDETQDKNGVMRLLSVQAQ